MPHPRDTLAAFQTGETRMIFARRRDRTPGLHFLADGAADSERKWTWAELLCPVEDCPTPDYTTVNEGDRKRDHYRHKVGNYRHSQESLFHLEGKAQIARRAAERYPEAAVVIEQASNKERERIADVMVTLAGGEQIALEIQYAALTPAAWQARHDSYAAQGISDVWLFGHTGAQMNARPGDGTVLLNPTHEAVAAAGMPVLWFNPLELQIGHVTRAVPVRKNRLDVLADGRSGTFHSSPLAPFALSPGTGLTDEHLDRLLADTRRYRVWHAQELAILTERALVAAQATEGRAAANAELAAAAAARRERRRLDFLESAEAEAIRARHRGLWPSFLNHPLADVGVPHEIWQARLFVDLIEPAEIGAHIASKDAALALNAAFALDIPAVDGEQTMMVWFDHLAAAGILRRDSQKLTRKRRATSFYRASPDAVAGDRPVPRWPAEESGRGSGKAYLPKPIAATGFVCGLCRGPLSEIFKDLGYHPLCANPVRRR